jgi:four helix bundle protein
MERKKWVEVFESRLIDFSASVIDSVERLPQTFAVIHLSKQLIRSSTSSALNYGEARAAESHKDFIHKLKICLKEMNESIICLKMLYRRYPGRSIPFDDLIKEGNELKAIFLASIKTSREKHLR